MRRLARLMSLRSAPVYRDMQVAAECARRLRLLCKYAAMRKISAPMMSLKRASAKAGGDISTWAYMPKFRDALTLFSRQPKRCAPYFLMLRAGTIRSFAAAPPMMMAHAEITSYLHASAKRFRLPPSYRDDTAGSSLSRAGINSPSSTPPRRLRARASQLALHAREARQDDESPTPHRLRRVLI